MRRIPELDAIRGLAALLIVLHHLRLLPTFGEYSFGGYAVDLFFVLSGYLITAIILRNSRERGFLLNFYARRGLRIWPIYYLCLLALTLAAPVLAYGGPHAHLEGLPYYLTYTQYIQLYWQRPPAKLDLPFYHTWTLAIEEQFYILWPALLCLVGRRGLVPAVGAFLAASLAARACGFSTWILLGRSDGLVLGALLAGLLAARQQAPGGTRPLRRWFALACLCGPALLAAGLLVAHALRVPKGIWWVAINPLAINLFFFGMVGLILCAAGSPALAALRDRRLCYLGVISYGLYLYHVPLIRLMEVGCQRFGVAESAWIRVGAILASVAVAVASWELIERPILSLRSRFEYRARPAPGPAEPPAVPEPVAVGPPA